MRRNTFLAFAMMAMIATTNIFAQRQDSFRDNGREMRIGNGGSVRMNHNNDRHEMRDNRHDDRRNNNGFRDDRRNDFNRHNDRHDIDRGFGRNNRHDIHDRGYRDVAMVPSHRFSGHFDRHGYVVGWEGRVRHHNGRWGYYRDNQWYWYNRYYEPDYFYAHPVRHFHSCYLGHDINHIVAGVAGTIAVGALISALCH